MTLLLTESVARRHVEAAGAESCSCGRPACAVEADTLLPGPVDERTVREEYGDEQVDRWLEDGTLVAIP